MKQSASNKQSARASARRAFQLRPVAAGCAVLLFGLADVAMAQSADSGAVVVTGIRRGIEDAISVKKNSDSIVEAVSAEDIGKLPDVSIAESIGRLPGIAAQRVAGRAQVIAVRGLSPDFATTLLNGREQVSTGDNRSVEFDQYPSELLSGVTIYKTPDAGLVGQGLSGTMNMTTVRPLSFREKTFALNARAEKNSLGAIANEKATGNRFSAAYIDQSADRTVGFAFGYAHLDSPILDQETGLYEPWQIASRPGLPAGTYQTNGAKSLARSGRNERDGVMGVLEFRPSKEWQSVIDVYASKFKRHDTANQFEVNLGDYNGGYSPGLNYTSATVAGNVIKAGTVTGVYPLVRGMYTSREDNLSAAGWTNTFKMDGWRLTTDLNTSRAKREEVSLENNLQISDAAGNPYLDGMKIAFPTGGFAQLTGNRDYSNPAALYVRNTIYGSGYGKTPKVDDKLNSIKIAANFDAPKSMSDWISTVDVGVNYSDRSKSKRQPEGGINLKGAPSTISSDLQYGLVDLGFAGSGKIPSWDVPGVVAKYMVFNPVDNLNYLISKGWDVNEKITTSFVKANLDHQLSPEVNLRGNFGVQVQNTDQSSDAKYWDGTAPAGSQVKPVHDGKSYTDVLPSLNLAFQLPNDQAVRMAVAKQIARARVDQLRSALDFNVSTVDRTPSGNGGNAKLDPWRANAFDISYEKYFGTKAYVQLSGFYKDLKTYIYTQTKQYDFSKFTPGTTAITNVGNYTAPYNGKGGSLKGAELAVSLPLNLVSKELDGFGVQASTTYTDSDITIEDPNSNIGSHITLPGLSKNVTNLTLYYEKAGFETRISQRRRSDFVGEIANFANDRTLRYVVGENVVDFQVSYAFREGTFKGLSVVLQANNLTDAAYETYADSKAKQLEYQKYGRTILLGLNYKM